MYWIQFHITSGVICWERLGFQRYEIQFFNARWILQQNGFRIFHFASKKRNEMTLNLNIGFPCCTEYFLMIIKWQDFLQSSLNASSCIVYWHFRVNWDRFDNFFSNLLTLWSNLSPFVKHVKPIFKFKVTSSFSMQAKWKIEKSFWCKFIWH